MPPQLEGPPMEEPKEGHTEPAPRAEAISTVGPNNACHHPAPQQTPTTASPHPVAPHPRIAPPLQRSRPIWEIPTGKNPPDPSQPPPKITQPHTNTCGSTAQGSSPIRDPPTNRPPDHHLRAPVLQSPPQGKDRARITWQAPRTAKRTAATLTGPTAPAPTPAEMPPSPACHLVTTTTSTIHHKDNPPFTGRERTSQVPNTCATIH